MTPRAAKAWTRSEKDTLLLIAAQAVRRFGQGLISIGIAIELSRRGLDIREMGVLFGAGVFGSALYTIGLNRVHWTLSRRQLLVRFTLFQALAAVAFSLVDSTWALIALTFVGGLAGLAVSGARGPAEALEHTLLANLSLDPRNAQTFVRYRVVGSLAGALGALAAGAPDFVAALFDLSLSSVWNRAPLYAFAGTLFIVALLYGQLSTAIEEGRPEGPPPSLLGNKSRRIIVRLNLLFSVDQLASSMTPLSLISYWFHTQHGFEASTLSSLFFVSLLLGAFSMWLSARLSTRIGLLPTMVFTHVPASLLLVALPFIPDPTWAVIVWLVRALLSQMDVPARDALTMTIVHPEERLAMSSLQVVGRNATGTIGPALSTALWQGLAAGFPLAAAGVLKVAYNAALYGMFHNIEHPPGQPAAGPTKTRPTSKRG